MEYRLTRLVLTLLFGKETTQKIFNVLMIVTLPLLVLIITYGITSMALESKQQTQLQDVTIEQLTTNP